MKIDSIKISNVLSFRHYDNLEDCPEIKFTSDATDDHSGDLHILIGPNGAGKSNFLEVINQLFKNILFKRRKYNKHILANQKSNPNFESQKKQVLELQDSNVANLRKNFTTPDNIQLIALSLKLNNSDLENIFFIVDNAQEFDRYIGEYSNLKISFNTLIEGEKNTFKDSIKEQRINIVYKRVADAEKFTAAIQTSSNALKFINQYLEFFEFLQVVIDVHNLERSDNQWTPLKNTFALIGCYRNYSDVIDTYSAKDANEKQVEFNLLEKHYKDTTLHVSKGEPVVFDLVKHKLSYDALAMYAMHSKIREQIIPALYETLLYIEINALLKEFLSVSLVIEIQNINDWTFQFRFLAGKNTDTLDFTSLSAGQKGIIHLIFSLYGYDIQHGLFVVDEPELHLHPQFQKKYVEILHREAESRDIQFIIATHSPFFINDKSIGNVKRFYFDEESGSTKAVQPDISKEDKKLVKILSYTNTAKIFFSNRAILVEGDSDAYFFNFYINNLRHSDKELRAKIDDFEIYNIEGKGNRTVWTTFLEKWKLKVSFIGDWDNVDDLGLIAKHDLNTCKDSLKDQIASKLFEKIKEKSSLDGKALFTTLFGYINNPDEEKLDELRKITVYLYGRYTPYRDLIQCLRTSKKLDTINQNIEEKYKDGIYILKAGELEDYLGIGKGVGNVIDFCSDFENKSLQNEEELKKIVECIFTK